MPQSAPALSLGLIALFAAVGLMGCAGLGNLFGAPSVDTGGCSPQVPAAYRIQAEVPVGALEILVLNAAGAPMASTSVMATRLVYTGARCLSMIEATSNDQGIVRFERMKTGPYDVHFSGESASASATVEADKTTTVTLKQP